MDLRSSLSVIPGLGWLARAAHPAIPFEPMGSQFYGPGIANQPQAEILLQESAGIFDAAARAIANRLSECEFEVVTKHRVEGGTEEEEVLDDHPLKALLDKPHPSLSRQQLVFLAARQIVGAGQAYWLKVSSGFRVPVELHPMPPGRVAPLVENGIVTGYLITDGRGAQTRLPANVVIRAYFPDPENPWGAEGYLSPMAVEADGTKFALQHLRYFFQHDATPKSTLEASGEGAQDFGPDAVRKFEQLWRERYHARAGSNVGIPLITPRGYKLILHALQSGKDITPLLEFWRDNLLMGAFTPRSVLGQVVSGDRSSAETNQYVFDRYAVLPVANLIGGALTLQLAPDFDKSIFVRFKQFVSEDKEFLLKRQAHRLEHAVDTINDVRVEEGFDKVGWGDTPIIATKLGPYDPKLELELKANPPAPPGGAPEGDEPEDDADDSEKAERAAHAAVRKRFAERRRKRAA